MAYTIPIPLKTAIRTSGQLGPLLKRLRVNAGLSQAALGAKIGLSQERISRIETRPEAVTLNQLLTLMMALQATISIESRRPFENDAAAAASGSGDDASDEKAIW